MRLHVRIKASLRCHVQPAIVSNNHLRASFKKQSVPRLRCLGSQDNDNLKTDSEAAPASDHAAPAPAPEAAHVDPQPSDKPAQPPLPPSKGASKGPLPMPPAGARRPAAFQKLSVASVLASYGAYTGLIGTLAVGTAWATDLNLAAMTDLGDGLSSDLQVAAAWVAPLLALNALIMLPNWSSWALPKLDAGETRAATLSAPSPIPITRGDTSAPSPIPVTRGDSSPSSPIPITREGAASTAPPPLIGGVSPSTSPTTLGDEPLIGGLSQAQTSQLLGRLQRAAAAAPSLGPGQPDSSLGGGRMVPASAWGKRETLSLKRVKDAFHLAQGHYTANNPTGGMHLGLELLTAAVHSLAFELLYRGVALTLLSRWLCDRFYEAGAEEALALPSWLLQGEEALALPSWLLQGEGSAISTPEAAKWSAAAIMVLISAASVVRKVGLPQRQISFVVDVRRAVGAKGKQPPLLAEVAKGKKAVDPKPEPLPLNTFSSVMNLTAGIQGARSIAQTAVLNFVFVATGGNLAASYAASLANQVLFSAMQRYSSERMRQRSAALAEELREFNVQMRAIKEKKSRAVVRAAEAEAFPVTPSTASAQPGVEELIGHSSCTADLTAPPPLSSEAVATFATAVMPATLGDDVMRGAASSLPSPPPDQLTKALTVLDLLLPEAKDKQKIA